MINITIQISNPSKIENIILHNQLFPIVELLPLVEVGDESPIFDKLRS